MKNLSCFTIRCSWLSCLFLLSFAAGLRAQDNTTLPPASFTWASTGFITTGGGYSIGTGQITRTVTDIRVAGSVGQKPLEWSRTLRQVNNHAVTVVTWSSIWSFSYNYVLTQELLGNSELAKPVVRYPSGVAVGFEDQESNAWRESHCPDRLVENLQSSGEDKWELQSPDGTKVFFDSTVSGTSQVEFPVRIDDAHGLQTVLGYETSSAGTYVTQISDASGRWIKIDYVACKAGKVPSHVYSSDGQEVWYQWDTSAYSIESRLLGVTYSDGTSASYTYTTLPKGILPDVCRDVRSDSPVRNIKYDFTIYEFAGAEIHYEKDADSGVVLSERSIPYQFQETRGDGATRALNCFGPDFSLASETDFLGNTQSYTYHQRGPLASVTDPKGRVTQYQREPVFGLETGITYPDGSSETFEYVGDHPLFLNRHTDVRGNATSYDLAVNGLINQTNYPDGSNEGWTYNEFNEVLTHRLRNGASERFDYDSSGRLLTRWLPSFDGPQSKITYSYYPDGHPWKDRLDTSTDALGNLTTYEYDLAFVNGVQTAQPCAGRGLVTKVTHADGTYQSFGYDIYGNKVWEENELRQRTSYTYDSYNRLLSHTDSLGRVTNYQYAADGAEPLALTSKKPHFVSSPSGKREAFSYDADLRISSQTLAYGTPDASTTTFTYDEVGNQTSITDPVGRIITFVYDNRDRKITQLAPLGRNTDWGYDLAGNVILETHPDGTSINRLYDSMNRVVSATDEMNRTTNYTYYPSGKVQWTIDPKNNSYLYDYDASDRATIFWLTNSNQNGFDFEQTSYDAAGNIASFRNRAGALKTFQYDNRNREISTSWNDGVTLGTSTSYDDTNRVTQQSNSASTIHYTYDTAGQLIEEQQTVAGTSTKTLKYEYDTDGNRTRLRKN